MVSALRSSRWAYPLVNAGHIMGLALLFGAIVPLDLRLLGVWRSIDADGLIRVLVPMAAVGLVTSVATGFLLFAVRATEYAALPLFQAKLGLIGLGLVNIAIWRAAPSRWPAVASLLLWTAVLLAGRLIGYVL